MSYCWKLTVLLVGFGLLAQPAPGQTPGQIPAASALVGEPYRIGPADVLFISVWQNAELTNSVPVRPDGRISLPLLKDVPAAGQTPLELAEDLQTRLKAYMTTSLVSVIVTEVNSYRVSVLGKVMHPGLYNFKAPTTVLEALAAAGGLQEYEKGDDIVVLRPQPGAPGDTRQARRYMRLEFNYRNSIDSASPTNFGLLPNDIVVVP